MLIVHAADLHIDSPLRGLGRLEGAPVDDIRLATRRAFVRLIEHCLERSAALLVLAGDVFDGEWRDFNTGLFFVRQLARLRQTGTRVIVLRGNHDAESALTRHIPTPEHVTVLSAEAPETVVDERLGVAIHGQSYISRVVVDNLAEAYPPPRRGLLNLGVLHTNAVGASEHKNYAPCTVGQLVNHGYAYWALGHVHRRAVLHEDPWVVYPGNLQGRHARETGAKGCMAVTVTDGRVVDVAPVDVDVLRWAEVVVRAPDDAPRASRSDLLEGLLHRVRERLQEVAATSDGRPVLTRITVTGETPLHARLTANPAPIQASVRALAADVGELWPEKIRFQTRPPRQGAPRSELLALHQALRREFLRLRGDERALQGHLEALAPLSAGVAQYMDARPDNVERARAQLEDVEALLLGALAPELGPNSPGSGSRSRSLERGS